MSDIVKAAISRIGDSKTYVIIIFIALLALIACIIAAAFGHDVWGRFFDLLLGQTLTAGGRAAVVDGAPKIAAAFKDPNSQAANPPSAMMELVPPPLETPPANTYIPRIPGGTP